MPCDDNLVSSRLETEHWSSTCWNTKDSRWVGAPYRINRLRRYAQLCRLTRAGSAPLPPIPSAMYSRLRAQKDAGRFEILGCPLTVMRQIPSFLRLKWQRKPPDFNVQHIDHRRIAFFETQGAASTIRYWLVAEKFRALPLRSALMRAILRPRARSGVSPFGMADNESAFRKYRHYGFMRTG